MLSSSTKFCSTEESSESSTDRPFVFRSSNVGRFRGIDRSFKDDKTENRPEKVGGPLKRPATIVIPLCERCRRREFDREIRRDLSPSKIRADFHGRATQNKEANAKTTSPFPLSSHTRKEAVVRSFLPSAFLAKARIKCNA